MPRHALMPGRDPVIGPDRVAKVGGAQLRYFDRGQGEPVLLIHGTSLCDSLAAPLRLYAPFYERHRVISYYRAGYDGSTFEGAGVSIGDGARHAVELLDHLGITKACNTFTHRRASRLRLRVGSWERVAVTRLGVGPRR